MAHSEAADRAAGASLRAAGEPRCEDSGADSLRPTGTLAGIPPVDRVAAAALVALGVLAALGNDRARVTARAYQVRLTHDAPAAGSLAADFDISLRNPNLHVVHVEDDIILGRVFDDAIPRAAP